MKNRHAGRFADGGYRAEPLPALATAATAKGDPRQAQTGAGARAVAAAEGLCAAARFILGRRR
jgi:hypothetical protein